MTTPGTPSSNRTTIIVAVIGVVGVIVSALIYNGFFKPSSDSDSRSSTLEKETFTVFVKDKDDNAIPDASVHFIYHLPDDFADEKTMPLRTDTNGHLEYKYNEEHNLTRIQVRKRGYVFYEDSLDIEIKKYADVTLVKENDDTFSEESCSLKQYELHPILKRGDKDSQRVRRVQEILGIEVDGIFGLKTTKALRDFQRDRFLPPTGEVDDETLEKLCNHYYARISHKDILRGYNP